MVKAIFIKKYFWSIFCLSCGVFLLVMFILCLINDVTDAISGVFFSVAYIIGSIISLFFNHKAYLEIENGHIKGKYSLCNKIDCKISDVEFVLAERNKLIIQLKNCKIFRIYGIENSLQLCYQIRQNINFEEKSSPQELFEELKAVKTAEKNALVKICIGFSLMVINIFVTVFLTSGKELSEFTEKDWTIYVIFAIVELIATFITFYYVYKVIKNDYMFNKAAYSLRRRTMETSRLILGNVIKVLTDTDYRIRITLFRHPNTTEIYYTLEKFDPNYSLIQVDESETFQSIEHIPKEIKALNEIPANVIN